jgi:hypothetical protein
MNNNELAYYLKIQLLITGIVGVFIVPDGKSTTF